MKTILLIFFLVISQLQDSFAQNWQWAKSAGSTSIDNLQDICTDNYGNIYAIGQFGFITPTASYMLFDTDTVYNNGVNQIFVAKYSSSGNIVWAKGIGGYNGPAGITCDNCEYANKIIFNSVSNSLYISGVINGTATFGNTNLTATNDLFLTKLDTGGNFIWTNLIRSNQFVSSKSVAYDLSDNFYICGYSEDSIKCDTVKVPPGSFIAKYGSNGTLVWAKREFLNAAYEKILCVGNNLYALGTTLSDTTIIDTIQYISTTFPNVFFSKFNLTGDVIESKFIGSSGIARSGDLSKDLSNNIYISGAFNTNAIFSTDTLFTNAVYDMFFIKYDSSGNLVWKRQANATNSVGAGTLLTTPEGYTYLAGGITGTATFGQFNISSIGNSDIFIARYDDFGNCLGAEDFNAFNGYFTADNSGNFILGGDFTTNATNPAFTIGNTSLTSIYASDIFIAKHDAITGIPDPRRSTNKQLFIHANPNEGKCNITVPDEFLHEKNLVLSIYNSSGKLIQQKNIEMNEGKIKLSLEAEAKGLYNAVLSNGSKSYSGKIVFE